MLYKAFREILYTPARMELWSEMARYRQQSGRFYCLGVKFPRIRMSALPELTEIAVLEKRYSEHSEHTLGQAFCLLVERWKRGARDRETAFRLLFLSWFANTEPAWLTGLDDPDAGDWFAEVFDFMGGLNSNDTELLFMVAYMADLDAWACGNNELLWIERSRQCRSKYEKLGTQSLVPATFRGRGAYGEYFSHVLENTDVRDYFLGK